MPFIVCKILIDFFLYYLIYTVNIIAAILIRASWTSTTYKKEQKFSNREKRCNHLSLYWQIKNIKLTKNYVIRTILSWRFRSFQTYG